MSALTQSRHGVHGAQCQQTSGWLTGNDGSAELPCPYRLEVHGPLAVERATFNIAGADQATPEHISCFARSDPKRTERIRINQTRHV